MVFNGVADELPYTFLKNTIPLLEAFIEILPADQMENTLLKVLQQYVSCPLILSAHIPLLSPLLSI